jgi:hypothetical protein
MGVTWKDKMLLLPQVVVDLQAELPTVLFLPVHFEALGGSYPTLLLHPPDLC